MTCHAAAINVAAADAATVVANQAADIGTKGCGVHHGDTTDIAVANGSTGAVVIPHQAADPVVSTPDAAATHVAVADCARINPRQSTHAETSTTCHVHDAVFDIAITNETVVISDQSANTILADHIAVY